MRPSGTHIYKKFVRRSVGPSVRNAFEKNAKSIGKSLFFACLFMYIACLSIHWFVRPLSCLSVRHLVHIEKKIALKSCIVVCTNLFGFSSMHIIMFVIVMLLDCGTNKFQLFTCSWILFFVQWAIGNGYTSFHGCIRAKMPETSETFL